MIDWGYVIASFLWIFACALALAALGLAQWKASVSKISIKESLAEPAMRITFNLAGLIFCISLAWLSGILWKSALWGILALGFAILAVINYRERVKKTQDFHP
jgi:hypothetical protein